MSEKLTAAEILDREFFEIRSKMLEIGASLDRMDRATGTVNNENRVQLLIKCLDILSSSDANRAEQIQLLFSREYSEGWREEFDLKTRF